MPTSIRRLKRSIKSLRIDISPTELSLGRRRRRVKILIILLLVLVLLEIMLLFSANDAECPVGEGETAEDEEGGEDLVEGRMLVDVVLVGGLVRIGERVGGVCVCGSGSGVYMLMLMLREVMVLEVLTLLKRCRDASKKGAGM